MTATARISIFLPVAGMLPMGVSSGPWWVPRQVSSSTTVSFPATWVRSNEALESGKAWAHPFQAVTVWSAPSILRAVATSS